MGFVVLWTPGQQLGSTLLHCVVLEVPSEVEENLRQAAILVICSSIIKSPTCEIQKKHVVNGARWGTEKMGQVPCLWFVVSFFQVQRRVVTGTVYDVYGSSTPRSRPDENWNATGFSTKSWDSHVSRNPINNSPWLTGHHKAPASPKSKSKRKKQWEPQSSRSVGSCSYL